MAVSAAAIAEIVEGDKTITVQRIGDADKLLARGCDAVSADREEMPARTNVAIVVEPFDENANRPARIHFGTNIVEGCHRFYDRVVCQEFQSLEYCVKLERYVASIMLCGTVAAV